VTKKPQPSRKKNPKSPIMLEAEAVPVITGWIDDLADMLTSEAGHTILRTHLRERLKAGAVSPERAIKIAEAGHHDFDMALRELAVEFLSQGKMPTELRDYILRALLRPPVNYPPGNNITDTWARDNAIVVLVQVTMKEWRLPKSRSHHSKHPTRPSACHLVALALAQRGIMLGERRVEKISDGNVEALGAKIAKTLSAFLALNNADGKPVEV
jgi:hypothetical protein